MSVETRREFVKNYLRTHPCVDCGETDIRCLEFDHIDREQKEMWIADAIWKMGQEKLEAEIDKCQVRCSNHHSIRHYEERMKGKHD